MEVVIFKTLENGSKFSCEDGSRISESLNVYLISYRVSQACSVVMFETVSMPGVIKEMRLMISGKRNLNTSDDVYGLEYRARFRMM